MGGAFTEGVIGRPGFINPILATSETDKDLSRLIYSGLLRHTPEGDLVNDLADELNISPSGVVYTVTLKNDVVFHDGEKITAEDIVFTIDKIKNPLIKSPLRASWDGVDVSSEGDKIIKFTLEQPYSLFIENLTLGILPKHIWKDFDVNNFNNNAINTNPTGSGPYKIVTIKRNGDGLIEKYKLESFKNFSIGRPYINEININFYKDENELIEAYRDGDINAGGGISPTNLTDDVDSQDIARFQLARVFAIFLNQNQADLFTNKAVRRAIDLAIDRELLVEEVLGGYGSPLHGPLVNFSLDKERAVSVKDANKAKEILIEDGWSLNENAVFKKGEEESKKELSFTLATANVDELVEAAKLIKDDLERIGIRVVLRIFEIGDLNQEIIRPRDYEALLFGEVTGRDPDLYAFWHSSQRLDPGLNIALYTNITTDKLLEDARVAETREARYKIYIEFEEEIQNDLPAIFLYAPDYLYIYNEKIKNVIPHTINAGSERFADIHNWNIKTDKVWRFLAK